MAEPRVELMEGPQWDFFESGARHPALFSGRGGGKTFALVAKVFRFLLDNPGSRGVMTEPTFDMIRRNLMPVIEEQAGHLRGNIWEYEIWTQGTPQKIVVSNGSSCDLRPAVDQAEKFRGATYAFFAMDEVAVEWQHDTFMALQPCLRQKGFPHQGWVTSTPDWRKPWLAQRWRDHINPKTQASLTASEYPIYQMKTAENWHLTKEDLAHWVESYGDTAYGAQELEGAFIIVEGAGFPMFKTDTHVREAPNDLVFVRTLGGLDFGVTSPTSMHEIRIDRSNKMWVTREFYQRDADDYDWVRNAVEWGLPEIYCDPSRSEEDLKKLRRLYGVPLKRARFKGFRDRVEVLSRRLAIREDGRPGMYISPSCVSFINELQSAAFAQQKGTEFPEDRWMPGTQDHAIDSTAYGAMSVDLPPPDFRYRPQVKVGGWRY